MGRHTRLALFLSLSMLHTSAAASMAPDEFVRRLEATGVWHWTSRTQQMQISQLYEGDRWDETLSSFEQWDAAGGYGQLSVIASPPAMARTRILGLWSPVGDNNRWLYSDTLRRPRRLPPMRVDGFLGNVFQGLGFLQQLPFLLRANRHIAIAGTWPDTSILTVGIADGHAEQLTLVFRGTNLLLTDVAIVDADGRPIQQMRLGEYEIIQGVPTPTLIRLATPDGRRRTRVRFTDVAYDTTLDLQLFQVATFGQTFFTTIPDVVRTGADATHQHADIVAEE